MTSELNDSSRKSLIAYRLERSRKTLEEVDYLIDGEFFSAAISRLYYACYYAVVALLVANKIETQTHSGIKTVFSLNFVRTNYIDKSLAKTFFQLFDLRHNNDYEDFCLCDRDTIEELRPLAGKFINAIERLLDND